MGSFAKKGPCLSLEEALKEQGCGRLELLTHPQCWDLSERLVSIIQGQSSFTEQ